MIIPCHDYSLWEAYCLFNYLWTYYRFSPCKLYSIQWLFTNGYSEVTTWFMDSGCLQMDTQSHWPSLYKVKGCVSRKGFRELHFTLLVFSYDSKHMQVNTPIAMSFQFTHKMLIFHNFNQSDHNYIHTATTKTSHI